MSQPMSDSDWQDVFARIVGLWPSHVAKMGADEPRMWRATLGTFPPAVVINALQSSYVVNKFFPKLPDVIATCKAAVRNANPTSRTNESHAVAAERERNERLWFDIMHAISQMSDEELVGHQTVIAAASPGMRFALRQNPRTSKGLMAQIVGRMREGWGPDTMKSWAIVVHSFDGVVQPPVLDVVDVDPSAVAAIRKELAENKPPRRVTPGSVVADALPDALESIGSIPEDHNA